MRSHEALWRPLHQYWRRRAVRGRTLAAAGIPAAAVAAERTVRSASSRAHRSWVCSVSAVLGPTCLGSRTRSLHIGRQGQPLRQHTRMRRIVRALGRCAARSAHAMPAAGSANLRLGADGQSARLLEWRGVSWSDARNAGLGVNPARGRDERSRPLPSRHPASVQFQIRSRQ